MSSSYLPDEIVLNILSRIPVKSVFIFKCVCKSWRKLLETREFARSHSDHSKPDPGWLLVNEIVDHSALFKIFEIEQGSCQLHHKRLIELDPGTILDSQPQDVWRISIDGSNNGLIFFHSKVSSQCYICNPITRECMELPTPPDLKIQMDRDYRLPIVGYGFGASRSSSLYKAALIHEEVGFKLGRGPLRFICEVYTLGTRSWRSINVAPGQALLEEYNPYSTGTFLNGNLHWLATDSEESWWVSCFDLETEDFTSFRTPMTQPEWIYPEIGVSRDCLCLCDDSSRIDFVIYRMNCYESKSWVKECVISKSPDVFGDMYEQVHLIKIFGDGDILVTFLEEDSCFFCYSNSTKERTELIRLNFYPNIYCDFQALSYTPSFVSLREFETEEISVTRF